MADNKVATPNKASKRHPRKRVRVRYVRTNLELSGPALSAQLLRMPNDRYCLDAATFSRAQAWRFTAPFMDGDAAARILTDLGLALALERVAAPIPPLQTLAEYRREVRARKRTGLAIKMLVESLEQVRALPGKQQRV